MPLSIAELIFSLTELFGNESVSDLMKLPPDASALPTNPI